MLIVTFCLLFEMLVLIQKADVRLRAQGNVIFVTMILAATVPLFLLQHPFATNLQQLLQLKA